ncbi:hypothetical protein HAX54_023098 [Datura stramonium]|uniref:Uncharacterized protein n=1 Tax=Datura stramonium TaxID=4076 RepID=A0ABS8UVM1_DATST|nr:hypothetical protein [Datura stramonium]
MRDCVGGASSNSAPRADEHMTGGTLSLESQTLLITPLATEAIPPDIISTPVTNGASVEVLRSSRDLASDNNSERARQPCDGSSSLAPSLRSRTAKSGITDK